MINGFGEFFELTEPDPSWPTLADLVAAPDRLTAAIGTTRNALGGEPVEARVAASIWFQGIAARILSPALAAAVLDGRPLHLSPTEVRLAPDGRLAGQGYPTPERTDVLDPDAAGAAVFDLLDAVLDAAPVSPQVLTGDVASALAGAATVIGLARPDLATPARELVRRSLAAHLPNTGGYGIAGFRRTSCCLWYRLPGAGVCSDCVLAR